MSEDNQNPLELVQQYQKLVEIYEALDEKIDNLIMANKGGTEHMSADDLKQYREWADQRSEVLNDMRMLEHQLNMDDEEED